eukprot:GHRR01029275.1.p1 GENE.GHRR01029275.1~~GHRR01029275.1.p1  ORF type:complete len:240 (+),score=70.47 GHRR01029275.1:1425-2144(+)
MLHPSRMSQQPQPQLCRKARCSINHLPSFHLIQSPWAGRMSCHCPTVVALLRFCKLWSMQEGRHLWVARRRLAAYAEKIYDLLQERYGTTSPPEDDRSLAACLMRMTDKHNNQPTRGALVAEIRDSLTASETVPSTVMWTVYSIATRPKLQQQLQEELAAAGILTGRSSSSSTITAPAGSGAAGQPVAYQLQQLQQRLQRLRAVFSEGGPDLLKQLPLLQACLNESMRLYPAGAPGAPR